MAVRTAEKLLKEVRPQSALSEHKVCVLENYILLATKSKPNVEKALEKFMDMASSEVSLCKKNVNDAKSHTLVSTVCSVIVFQYCWVWQQLT